MTDFDWLSADRLLQRTVFDDNVELIANFPHETHRCEGITVPGRSLLARWRQTGKSRLHVLPRASSAQEK